MDALSQCSGRFFSGVLPGEKAKNMTEIKLVEKHFDNQDSCDWLTENGWEVGLVTTLFNRTFHSSHTLGETLSKDTFVFQEQTAFS